MNAGQAFFLLSQFCAGVELCGKVEGRELRQVRFLPAEGRLVTLASQDPLHLNLLTFWQMEDTRLEEVIRPASGGFRAVSLISDQDCDAGPGGDRDHHPDCRLAAEHPDVGNER